MSDRKIPDYLTSWKDSVHLANRIRKYWARRGVTVNVVVEKFMMGSAGPYYQIRSDLFMKGSQDEDK